MPESYPERLLPSSERISVFNYTNSCFICRRTEIDKTEMYDDDDGDLEPFAINEKELIDCSTNLINHPEVSNCVETVPDDVLINVMKNGDIDYTRIEFEDDSQVPRIEDVNFTIASDKGYYFIPMGALNNIETTFPFNKKQNAPKLDFRLVIKVEHCPTVVNLCHFEIRCFSEITGKYEKVKRGDFKGFRAEICHVIQQIVLANWKKEI